jgi:hypothetical protein
VSSDREKTFKIDPPIDHKSILYDEITFKAPTIGQFRQALAKLRHIQNQETQLQFGEALLARSAGLEEEVIDLLPADVFFEGMDFVTSFLPEEKAPEVKVPEVPVAPNSGSSEQ